ncbi:GNAT family N-acetyltransferase [Rossellomorea aquimaris]|uniref:GNAT family N-acetyltransferase n=1 Tax=Rossellomorea aquimaris TaxID=189382 RepID=UPI0007D087C6|nr:GNAT family protein [Rossellomorea aquimaris]
MNTQMESERLLLREIKNNDWKEIHLYASQSIVCQYQPWGPNTEEETINFVKQVIEDSKLNPRSRYMFALIEKESNRLIGACEINVRDIENQSGEIGYIIHPDYWGKGYGTEAAKKVIQFGFTTLQLHRLYATCDPQNLGSAKVLEKIGLIKEGTLREVIMLKDGWRDSCIYSILKKEWNEISHKGGQK